MTRGSWHEDARLLARGRDACWHHDDATRGWHEDATRPGPVTRDASVTGDVYWPGDMRCETACSGRQGDVKPQFHVVTGRHRFGCRAGGASSGRRWGLVRGVVRGVVGPRPGRWGPGEGFRRGVVSRCFKRPIDYFQF